MNQEVKMVGFGQADILMALILFGGSIFVAIVLTMLFFQYIPAEMRKGISDVSL